MDQENGGVNSLYDEEYICQFPSAMGIAATGDLDMALEVARATALEVSAIGVNMILGPVLDVLASSKYQPLGVRAISDDPQEVSQYGIASMKGFKNGGITTCGKHFPSYGNLDFQGSCLDMPTITESMEQLSLSALVPFRNAIAAGVDAIMVGGCAIANAGMSVMHACLSEQIVDDLLRRDLGFNKVVISECLEMDALNHDIGVRGGTVMAVEAGCDLVLLCRSFSVQQEALSGLKIGIETEMVSIERLRTSLRRVLRLKSACTSWEKALNPPGVSLLSAVHDSHLALSTKAYNNSITVMRDNDHLLPLSKSLHANEGLLLLTPLLKPLPASAATKFLAEQEVASVEQDHAMDRDSIMSGEFVFRGLGRSLARRRHGKLLHTSYTAHGVQPIHEGLIERAAAIIVVTADTNRNLYQYGFTKHVAMMCSLSNARGKKKSLIVVSVSSPYDFAMDKAINTYICTYDFTEAAMAALVRVLFGEFVPRGSFPGTLRKNRKAQKPRQNWLVEAWSKEDSRGLNALIEAVNRTTLSPLSGATAQSFELLNSAVEESHFVVRNSNTQALYGFCSTYYYHGTGSLGVIFVDPAKRNLSIGNSLYRKAIGCLLRKPGIRKLRLGTSFPYIYPGLPITDKDEGSHLRCWFENDWTTETSAQSHACIIRALQDWSPPDDLVKTAKQLAVDFEFNLVHGLDHLDILSAHIRAHADWETLEIYRLALDNADACGVLCANSRVDGELVGTVILARHGSTLTRYVPVLNTSLAESPLVNGILSPVIARKAKEPLVLLQGLLFRGIQLNQVHRSSMAYLNGVSGSPIVPRFAPKIRKPRC